MDFRPTKPCELPLINAMFEKTVTKMNSGGFYDEVIDDTTTLREYGYEIEL